MNAATASPPLRFPWRWLLVAIAAYLVFLIAGVPAARITTRLQALGVQTAGVSGTIWNGRVAALQVRGLALGPTQWQLNPWRLLTGKLGASVQSKSDTGYLDADVVVALGGSISVRNLRASLPLSALSGLPLPAGGVNGWSGMLQLNLDALEVVKQWPTTVIGRVDVLNLFGPAQQPTQLGGYRITFPPERATDGALQGIVSSQEDAPLDVIGTIRLAADRNYVIDAQVATRASAPSSITKALQYLGPPDAQGRRPLSIAGSL